MKKIKRPIDPLPRRQQGINDRREIPENGPSLPGHRVVHQGVRAARMAREMPLDTVHPEALLISAVIQTGQVSDPGEAGITAEHFHAHRPEWEWMERFVLDYQKCPDKVTFRTHFPDFPLMKTTDVDHHIAQVHKSHLRHSLAKTLKESTRLLVADRPEQALEETQRKIAEIERAGSSRVGARDVIRDHSQVFAEAARRAERAASSGLAGVDTGFDTLNDRTGGVLPGDLWIMAARLGCGKTWTLVRMAHAALMQGKKVCFITLEQTVAQIMFRVHTMMAREFGYSIRNTQLMKGVNLDLREYKNLLASLPEKVPGELFVADPSGGTTTPFSLHTMIERHDPDVMFVDYITLMKKATDDWQGVAKLSGEIKQIALQTEVGMVCAAQINRLGEGGNRPPTVDKLSQGDSIGQDADVVVTQRKYGNTARQNLLAKNRSGSDGIVYYSRFLPDVGDIGECSYDEAMRLAADAATEED